MALLDDLATTVDTHEISRRKVLEVFASSLVGAAALGTAITTVRYLHPNVLFEAATRFRIGRPEDMPVGTLTVLRAKKLYIVHAVEGFYALSSTCTHLGCMTRFFPEKGIIACPCHGSRFDKQGNVIGGPAPRPLPRFALTLEGDQLVVDTNTVVPHDFVLEVA